MQLVSKSSDSKFQQTKTELKKLSQNLEEECDKPPKREADLSPLSQLEECGWAVVYQAPENTPSPSGVGFTRAM